MSKGYERDNFRKESKKVTEKEKEDLPNKQTNKQTEAISKLCPVQLLTIEHFQK